MKQSKRLTLEQKKAVSAAGLEPDKWALVSQTEFYLNIIHKTTGATRRIDRYALPKKGARHERSDKENA